MHDLPPFEEPDLAAFGWAIAIGVAAVVARARGPSARLALRAVHGARGSACRLPLAGLVVAALAVRFAASHRPRGLVMCSSRGRTSAPADRQRRYSVGALLLLLILRSGWPTSCR